MKKFQKKCMVSVSIFALVLGFTGCRASQKSEKDTLSTAVESQGVSENASIESGQQVSGLSKGFPSEIPLYSGGQVIESDHFNGNHYTVLYTVNEDYQKVVDFYLKAFDLDNSGGSDGVAYYEGFEFGDILIQGLTVEENGDAVNVFMTIQDNGQEEMVAGETVDNEDTADYGASDVVTYHNAEEVSLDDNYPNDVVPIHANAKVIGCSIVPDTRSGFVDLILPGNEFDDAVSFYADALGVKAIDTTTTVQQATSFKGEKDNIKFSILISHLQSSGNDTFIQITVNEN